MTSWTGGSRLVGPCVEASAPRVPSPSTSFAYLAFLNPFTLGVEDNRELSLEVSAIMKRAIIQIDNDGESKSSVSEMKAEVKKLLKGKACRDKVLKHLSWPDYTKARKKPEWPSERRSHSSSGGSDASVVKLLAAIQSPTKVDKTPAERLVELLSANAQPAAVGDVCSHCNMKGASCFSFTLVSFSF